MKSMVFRYEFHGDIPMEEVESSLLLSLLGVESLHGETEVQLNAHYSLEPAARSCLVDAGTQVGRDLNRLFAGFIRREFGRDQFRVRRVDGPTPSQMVGRPAG
jgi:hypothetical protein